MPPRAGPEHAPCRRNRAEEALAGFRRSAAREGCGRAQADGLKIDSVAAILETARLPRKLARDTVSEAVAARRGTSDISIIGLLFRGGLHCANAAALEWHDILDAPTTPGAILVTLRASRTDQEGQIADARLVKNGFAAAIRSLHPSDAASDAKVLGGISTAAVARRLAAANATGIEGRINGHSGRVGLAIEATRIDTPTLNRPSGAVPLR